MIVCLFLFFFEFVSWEFFLLRMSNSLSHSSEIYPSLAYSLSYQPSLFPLFIIFLFPMFSCQHPCEITQEERFISAEGRAHELRLFLASHTFILHHHHAKFINAAYAKRMYLYQNFRSKPKPTKLNVLFCSFSDQIMKLRELNKSKHEANISTHTDILRFRNIAMQNILVFLLVCLHRNIMFFAISIFSRYGL